MGSFDAIYVSNFGASTVSVVDVATDTIVHTVSVDSGPTGIGSTPLGDRVMVGCQTSSFVDIIDTTTYGVTSFAATNAQWISFDPTSTWLYVTFGATSPTGQVVQYDLTTYALLFSTYGTSIPTRFSASPDLSSGAWGPENTAYVQFCDPTDVHTSFSGPVVFLPSIAGQNVYSLDSLSLYVVEQGSAAVAFIDVTTHTISTTVGVGNNPYGIAITPDGLTLYVCNTTDNTVSIIDIGSATVTNTLTGFTGPSTVTLTADGTKAYVCNTGGTTVSVINTSTFAISTITGFSEPFDVTFAPASVSSSEVIVMVI